MNLELPDNREFATIDPSGFFEHYSGNLILDEIQHVPTLLSYIAGSMRADGLGNLYLQVLRTCYLQSRLPKA